MSESVREPEISLSPEASEQPGKAAVLVWVRKNRDSLQKLLRRTNGDVRIKISEHAAREANLEHQHVLITEEGVFTADGMRHLASFKDTDAHKTTDVHSAEAA